MQMKMNGMITLKKNNSNRDKEMEIVIGKIPMKKKIVIILRSMIGSFQMTITFKRQRRDKDKEEQTKKTKDACLRVLTPTSESIETMLEVVGFGLISQAFSLSVVLLQMTNEYTDINRIGI